MFGEWFFYAVLSNPPLIINNSFLSLFTFFLGLCHSFFLDLIRLLLTLLLVVFFYYRITISRAKALAAQYNIADLLHPLFADDPAIFFYAAPPPPPPMLSMPPGYYYPHAQFGPPPPPPPYLRQQHHHHHPHPANGKLNFYL